MPTARLGVLAAAESLFTAKCHREDGAASGIPGVCLTSRHGARDSCGQNDGVGPGDRRGPD